MTAFWGVGHTECVSESKMSRSLEKRVTDCGYISNLQSRKSADMPAACLWEMPASTLHNAFNLVSACLDGIQK